MPIPNLIRKTLASLAVSEARTSSVAKCKLSSVAFSKGDSMTVSSIKSPKLESSSSPIGVSVEIGSLAIFKTFLTLSSGISSSLLSSSGVGSLPISCII